MVKNKHIQEMETVREELKKEKNEFNYLNRQFEIQHDIINSNKYEIEKSNSNML